jgi:hypothetical protein
MERLAGMGFSRRDHDRAPRRAVSGSAIRLLPVLLVVLAAGCGGHGPPPPEAFAHCGTSPRGADLLVRTFDCLAGAYREDCRPAQARVLNTGVDTVETYRLQLFRRGSHCVARARHDNRVLGVHYTAQDDCRLAYLTPRKSLTLYDCGDSGNLEFIRGPRACRVQSQPPYCRRHGIRLDAAGRCFFVLRAWVEGC